MASDGDKYERDIRDWFWDIGGSGIRIPASGSATKKPLPDVLGSFGGVQYAIEQKYTSGKHARFQKEEARKLFEFCEAWGAVPLFTARFSQDTDFYVLQFDTYEEIEELNDNQSFALYRKDKHEYPTLSSLVTSSAIDW